MVRDWTFRQLAAEFFATMLFIWAGCGAAVASNRWTTSSAFYDPAALVCIALAFGLSISVLAYGIGHISGGHINPAVTLAFVLLRLQSIVAGVLYIVCQCLGAIVGAFIVWGCNASITQHCDAYSQDGEVTRKSGVCDASRLPNGSYGPPFGLASNGLSPRTSVGCGFFLEMMGTYLLVFTVLHSAVHAKSTGGNAIPIAIGWSILVAHLILVPYTGCGINPARSLGPMVVDSIGGMNKWGNGAWIFYTAPFVGSMLATATYKLIFEPSLTPDEVMEKRKKNDEMIEDDVEEGEGAVAATYKGDAKNTGSVRDTVDEVPHTYK